MKYSVGIDLGTTYSCLAVVDIATGEPTVVKNNMDHETTPSVILYMDGDGFIVGECAKDQAGFADPYYYIEAIKRHMSEVDTFSKVNFGGQEYGPIELSAQILVKLLNDFKEQYSDADLDSLTITCPAYFGAPEREATKQAGILAVAKVFNKDIDNVNINIIEEPTAAAISYGLNKDANKTIMVYDLGGGTFDVTIMKIEGNNFKVITTDGDSNLGGKDWDNMLSSLIKEKVCENGNIEIEEIESNETAMGDLKKNVEGHKITLSSMTSVKGNINVAPSNGMYTVTREEFEDATSSLLDLANNKVQSALASAKMTIDDMDDIIMVGGSTKMPQVKARLIADYPQCESKIHIFDPNMAVAKGACIYQDTMVNMLGPDETFVAGNDGIIRAPPVHIEKVLSHTYGVYVHDEEKGKMVVSNIIFKNKKLPLTNSNEYGVSQTGQTVLNIRIYQSEFDAPEEPEKESIKNEEECNYVGQFEVNIPSDSIKGEPVGITFEATDKGDIICTCKYRDIEKTYQLDMGDKALSQEQMKQKLSIM